MRRCESAKHYKRSYDIYTNNATAHQCNHHYDYITKHSSKPMEERTPNRAHEYGGYCQNEDNYRNYQMNIIQNKRDRIEDIKLDENISQHKNTMNKLMSTLKNELHQISRHIKETDHKVDYYLNKDSTYKGRRMSCGTNSNNDMTDMNSSKTRKVVPQCNIPSSNTTSNYKRDINIPPHAFRQLNNEDNENKTDHSNCGVKKKYVFDTQENNNVNERETARTKKDYPYHIDYMVNRYHVQNKPSANVSIQQNNHSNDHSVTYQYEKSPNDLGLTYTQYKYNSIYNNSKHQKVDSSLQGKIALLEEKAATTDKVMPDLVEKLHFFKQNYELMKSDKEKLEYKCSSLETELYEIKKSLREEIEIKKSYLALSNQTDDTLNKYKKTINDQENQIKMLQQDLHKAEEEMQANIEDYRLDLKEFISEKEALKRTIQQLNNDDSHKFELRKLNDVIARKDLELQQEKLLIEDMKKQLENMRDAHTFEKNELIKKITKINIKEDSAQDNKLLAENKALCNEITILKQQLESIQQKILLKQQNEKTATELKEMKEKYETVVKEYKDYQITMEKTLKDKTVSFTEEKQKATNQYENQMKLDSERKNTQMKILMNELDSKKIEIETLVTEIQELKSMINQLQKEHKEQSSTKLTSEKNDGEIAKLKKENMNYNKIIEQLNQDNSDYNGKLKRLIEEKSKANETITNLQSDLTKLSEERKIDIATMKELNDLKNKLQNKKTIESKEVAIGDKEKETLIKEKKDLQEIIDKLKTDIVIYQQEYKDATQKNEADTLQMNQENKGLLTELDTTKDLLKQSNSIKEELEIKLTSLNKTLEESEKLNNQLKEEIASYKSQLDSGKDKEMTIQIQNLKKQLAINEEELINSYKKNNELTTLLSTVTTLAKEKENDISDINNSKAYKEAEIEQYKAKVNTLNDQLINAQSELNLQKDSNDMSNNKIKSLTDEIELVNNEKKIMKEKDSNTQKDLNESLNAITKLNAEIDTITKDNENKLTLKSKEIEELNDQLSQIKFQENTLRTEYEQLKLLIASKEKNVSSIESSLLAEKDKLSNELKTLKQEIITLKESESNLKVNNEQLQIAVNQWIDCNNLNKDQYESTIAKINKNKTELETTIQSQESIITKLTEENQQLKEQIEENNKQSPKLLTLLDEKELKITALTEENQTLIIEASKIKGLETQIQKEKKENQTTFAQLKAQMENNENLREELKSQKDINQGLLDELEAKKEEVDQLTTKITSEHQKDPQDLQRVSKNFSQGKDAKSDSFTDDLIGSYNFPQSQEEVDDLCQTITQCKETIMTLQTSIKEKDDEIATLLNERDILQQEVEDFKELNAKLIQKNTDLAASKPFKTIDSENHRYRESLTNLDEIKEDDIESLKTTIENLKQIIVEKENEIALLHQKPTEELKEFQPDQLSVSRISQSSLTDAERCTKYQKRIEEYKEQYKSAQEQINFLKLEIKDLNNTIEKTKTFEGKISSYDEFIKLFGLAFENYKPKKKEQEDAFRKIEEHLGGNDNDDSSSVNKKIKKGLFSKLFK